MVPTVVIAYSGFGDIRVEEEVLRAIDATVLHIGNLDTPDALGAVKQADVDTFPHIRLPTQVTEICTALLRRVVEGDGGARSIGGVPLTAVQCVGVMK